MRFSILISLFAVLFSVTTLAQTRQQTIEEFENLRSKAKLIENRILMPEETDKEAAAKENAAVFRLLPRETYDKGFFTVRGGGAYYSFFFKIHDWGHGSDIGLEQGYLETGFQGCGFISDLGKVSLEKVNEEIPGVSGLLNYDVKKSGSCSKDYYSARQDGFKLNDNVFRTRLPAIVGHTYLVRSVSFDYYDILTVFQIWRKDTDGSLIIFWKEIEQFETPQRNPSRFARSTDTEILQRTQHWSRSELFPKIKVEVSNGIVILSGKVSKSKLAYAVQLSHSYGASKVINHLTIE